MVGKSNPIRKFVSRNAPVCFSAPDQEDEPVRPRSSCGRSLTMPWRKPTPVEEEKPWWKPGDHYEDTKTLIYGSEAQTHLTKSLSTRHVFVVKRFNRLRGRPDLQPLTQGRMHFTPNEATVLLKRLGRHPNILHAFGCDEFPATGEANLYTEYCSGGDLHSQMLRFQTVHRPPPESFILHAFISLASALSYIHHGLRWDSDTRHYHKEAGFEMAYVHGDIKLENVFLRWSDEAKRSGLPDVILGDFGAAQPAHDFKGIAGTTGYQAPEASVIFEMKTKDPEAHKVAIKMTGIMTPASDVFSLGQVMHHLCTGRQHIVGADPDTEPAQRSDHGVVGVEIGGSGGYSTKELQIAVRQCLQKEPSKRPETMEEGLLASVAIFRDALEERTRTYSKIPREMWASPPAIRLN